MFPLKQSCCGCSLRSGTLIVIGLYIIVELGNSGYEVFQTFGLSSYRSIVVVIVYLLLSSIIYGLAFFGAVKNRPTYLLPFVGVNIGRLFGALNILLSPTNCYLIFSSKAREFHSSDDVAFTLFLIFWLAQFVFDVYVTALVCSFYIELQKKRKTEFSVKSVIGDEEMGGIESPLR